MRGSFFVNGQDAHEQRVRRREWHLLPNLVISHQRRPTDTFDSVDSKREVDHDATQPGNSRLQPRL